jgi:hypothetical protein
VYDPLSGVYLLNDTILAVMKVRASLTPTGPQPLPITLTDMSPALNAASFNLNDNTNLDPIIFAAAHNNFPLFIMVAVPEPSSMCLAGLALVGFGCKAGVMPPMILGVRLGILRSYHDFTNKSTEKCLGDWRKPAC